jgi:hypothetical protein
MRLRWSHLQYQRLLAADSQGREIKIEYFGIYPAYDAQ